MAQKIKKTKANDSKSKKRLVLLDTHAIIHRAYHAIPDFATSHGEPTGALYGLSSMLLRIISELKPDYLAACYDLPEPTYRHEVYKEYKAGRPKADPALVSQIIKSRDIFNAFKIPYYEKAGFEADDLLGTIVEKLKDSKDLEIIIASGDMDTLQLVEKDRVSVFTLKKGIKETIVYKEKDVIDRYGFKPTLVPDYKGLAGDPSDNIMGVPGIGVKGASALIVKFGSIEKIYKALQNREKFLEAGFKVRTADLLEKYKDEAEFSKMLAVINRNVPIEFALDEVAWSQAKDIEQIRQIFIDLEFRSLIPRMNNILGDDEQISSERFEDKTEEDEEDIDKEKLQEASIALWVLNSSFTNAGQEEILRYAKTDRFEDAGRLIFAELEKQGLKDVYDKIEYPLIPVIKGMTRRGITINKNHMSELSRDMHKRLESLAGEVWKLAGKEFNINSPKQLGVILFEELGLGGRGGRRTPGGARSTNEKELIKLRDNHPIIQKILDYREVQKLLSTYIDALPKLADENSRIHAQFLQNGTVTGRMSSNNPNLQNIPQREDVRRGFVATDGFELVAFDYSQIELRLAAILSGDKALIDIFKKGKDVHQAVAEEVFGVGPREVDKETRRKAKVINFGILYGMGVNALRENLGTSREEAASYIENYFHTYSGLSDYLEEIKSSTKKRGFTETLFGRRRFFPGISSPLNHIREQALRMAINAPIQGTSADIIKIAMIRIGEYIRNENLEDQIFMLLQIHDELVFEIANNMDRSVVDKIQGIMESVISLEESKGVPTIVNISRGSNWGEMRGFEV